MLPIAQSPCAPHVALWVAGGDQTAFTPALAAHEKALWTCGHTGGVDESLATFDDREWWIARCLARQGHNVIALPPRPVAGLRSPDAAVSGLLVEFKTYRGTDPRQLLRKVGDARPQADRAVIGFEAQWDPAMVRSVFRAAVHSAIRRRMRGVVFIGDDFQFEWGDWNPCFTPPEESIMGPRCAMGRIRASTSLIGSSTPGGSRLGRAPHATLGHS
jgi:hypothetical protein